MPRVDDGSGGKKKKKFGFKVDRAKHYNETVRKAGGKNASASAIAAAAALKKKNSAAAEEASKTSRVKSITFDENARREYLLGMHKRKNERRVDAVIQRRRKHRTDQSKLRRELREEARQQYNSAARVPILPDYSFEFPNQKRAGDDDEDGDGSGADDDGITRNREYDVGTSVTVSVAPLQGKQQRLRSLSRQQQNSASAAGSASSAATAEARGRAKSAGIASERDALLLDPTIPDIIKQRLARVRKEAKGPAQPRIKVRHVKEMKKILKIKKHSRKGHGKVSKSGAKKKNR